MADEQRVLELLRALDASATSPTTPRHLDPVWQTITNRIESGDVPQISGVDLDPVQDRRKGNAMNTLTTGNAPQHDRRTRLRPAFVAAAIAALVVLATTTVLVTGDETTPDVVVDPSGVPSVIRTSLDALEAGDWDAWRAVRSSDAVLSDGFPVVEDSPMRRAIARQGELELQISILGCDETTAPADASTRTFTCRIEGSDAIMRTVGLIDRLDWDYVIRDGRIVESSPPFFGASAESAQVLGELATYLRGVDRATLDEVCDSGAFDFFSVQVGPECTQFIMEHLGDFAAQRSNQP